MSIQNFPAALQPIIQQGFLEREFEDSLKSKLVYRRVADREVFPNRIGETLTKTRPGLKAAVTTPNNPAGNTNLDNGMTPSTWTVEQFTLNVNQYSDTIDLNIINEGVGIASQFVQNARVNAFQAAQSVDRLARNALFNAYLGGNTRVRTTLGAPAASVAVDDVRGFLFAPQNGVMQAVSAGNTATVLIAGDSYTLVGVTPDATNVSTAPGGISGVLTFSGNVTVADGTAGNAVVHYNAPTILRANSRSTTAGLVTGDILTMGLLLDAQAQLRNNAPILADERMVCYLDNKSMRQLFADQDFKLLYQGQYGSDTYRNGTVFSLLGIEFVPTTEAFVQPMGGINVRRPILCIPGALVEADFQNTGKLFENESQIVTVSEGIAQVTRPPL
ncbi:MAG: hypothetical protein JO218_14605, partial [Burkholderiales bacterium]|nr:hypothetical protein [Burkholderiales bacterium]